MVRLAKKERRKVAVRPFISNGKVGFEIVGEGKPFPGNFEPSKGAISRAITKCLICDSRVDDDTVRKLFQQGKAGQRMVAVVLHNRKRQGKRYRLATEKDLEIFCEAGKYLEKKRQELFDKWGISAVPDEPTPEGKRRAK